MLRLFARWLSLSNGLEVQTPPASLDALEDIIEKTCKTLNDYNYYIKSTCGLHVHIDTTKIGWKNIRNFIYAYTFFEDLIFDFLPTSRRKSTYCLPIVRRYDPREIIEVKSKDELELLWYYKEDSNLTYFAESQMRNENISFADSFDYRNKVNSLKKEWKQKGKPFCDNFKRDKWNCTRYTGINLHSYFFRGTIEMRHHSGSLNPEKILKWIQFNLELLRFSKKLTNSKIRKLKKIKKLYSHVDKRIALVALFDNLRLTNKDYFLNRFDFIQKHTQNN